jgi:hypothetical protein
MMRRNSPDVNLSLQGRVPETERKRAVFGNLPVTFATRLARLLEDQRPSNGSQLTRLEQDGYAWSRYQALDETNRDNWFSQRR